MLRDLFQGIFPAQRFQNGPKGSAHTFEEEKGICLDHYDFVLTLEILESTGANMKCKFQGTLMVGDNEPREIQISEISPGKRRDETLEFKMVDMTFANEKGAIAALMTGGIGNGTGGGCCCGGCAAVLWC